MADHKYRIDPDFVVPEPTPADHFWCLDDPGDPELRRQAIDEALTKWRERGEVKQVRVTITGPEIEGDETNYPAGIWLEGWDDANARMLGFGEPWPTENSAIWPPLTTVNHDSQQRR